MVKGDITFNAKKVRNRVALDVRRKSAFCTSEVQDVVVLAAVHRRHIIILVSGSPRQSPGHLVLLREIGPRNEALRISVRNLGTSAILKSLSNSSSVRMCLYAGLAGSAAAVACVVC